MMRNRIFALMALLICLASAHTTVTPFADTNPTDPGTAILEQIDVVFSFIGPLMLVMIIIAAAAYVVGQILGSETRAKATVWAQSLLVAVGICALILAIIYWILPDFFIGNVVIFDIADLISDPNIGLLPLASTAFGILVLVFIILAAAAYILGQYAGAETRARASVWAQNMLAGAIICAAIYIIITNIILPFETTIFSQPVYGGVSLGNYGALLINLSILLTIIVLATYLISQFFKVPEWEAYLNVELSHLMSSFVLFLFVVGMFAVTEVVVSSFYDTSTYSNAPEAVIGFMTDTVSQSALKASMDVYTLQACTSMMSTLSKRAGEFVLTQTFKVFPGLDTFVSATNALAFVLVTFYATVSAQIALLHLVEGLMIPFVLPAGLLLRFFPPTRDAGAFLISVAFAFQLVYPALYLINARIYAEMGGESYSSPDSLIQSICGPLMYGAAGYMLSPTASPLLLLSDKFSSLVTLLGKLVSESFLNMVAMSLFIPFVENIASMSLLVLFMPALAMLVTIAFINVMTKFIVNKG